MCFNTPSLVSSTILRYIVGSQPVFAGWRNDSKIPVMGAQEDVFCFAVGDSREMMKERVMCSRSGSLTAGCALR